MTIEEAKIKLHKEGYCSFNMSDFDVDLFEIIKKFECDSTKSEKETTTWIRADLAKESGKENINKDFIKFDAANKIKEEILSELKKDDIFQIWFYGYPDKDIMGLRKIYTKLTQYFYDIADDINLNLDISLTMYNDGCFLNDHIDGKSPVKNYASMLIYLNKNWNESDGGNLILKGNDGIEYKVTPEFGNVAIIDLQNFDVWHQVEEVKNNKERYAIVCFPFDKKNQIKND